MADLVVRQLSLLTCQVIGPFRLLTCQLIGPFSMLTCQLIGSFSLLTCPLSLCLTVHCHFLPHTGQHGRNQVHFAWFNFTRATLGPIMAAIL